MKIVFLCYNLINGGAQRVVSVFSNFLVRDHDIIIVVKAREKNEYHIESQVKVISLENMIDGNNAVSREIKTVKVLRNIFKEEKPDHIISFLGYETEAYIATRGLSVKFITAIRNSPWSSPAKLKKRVLRNLIVALSDACMVQNTGQMKYFPDFIRKKQFVISNPVNEEYINCDPHRYRQIQRVVTLGRLREQKNHILLIDAFAKVCNKINMEIYLEIYGIGPMKNKLLERIAYHHLEDRIKIFPFTANALAVYQSADMFILSSDYEGMPNALLEAMAVGLPCISTDCRTGPSDMINDGVEGYLVPVGDVDLLSSKMLEIITSEDLAYEFGTRARKRILENNSPQVICSELVKRLEELMC